MLRVVQLLLSCLTISFPLCVCLNFHLSLFCLMCFPPHLLLTCFVLRRVQTTRMTVVNPPHLTLVKATPLLYLHLLLLPKFKRRLCPLLLCPLCIINQLALHLLKLCKVLLLLSLLPSPRVEEKELSVLNPPVPLPPPLSTVPHHCLGLDLHLFHTRLQQHPLCRIE